MLRLPYDLRDVLRRGPRVAGANPRELGGLNEGSRDGSAANYRKKRTFRRGRGLIGEKLWAVCIQS